MNNEPLITQIQKFAVNDGPGFRTNVFLKGCLLRCRWCHNPETQAQFAEVFWKKRLCVQCGKCLDACPNGAINAPIDPVEASSDNSTYHKIIRSKCDNCLKCVDVCIYGALEISGKPMSIDEILDEVEQDAPFYATSGGGMTLSGGEPAFHKGFSGKLMDAAKERALHICMDTSGFCNWEDLEFLSKKADIILYDLKHIDSAKHKMMTGVENDLILKNLSRLVETGAEIWVRVLVIPDFSESMDDHNKIADYLSNLPKNIERIDILPFHNWCEGKYEWLGRDWPMAKYQAIDPGLMEPIKDLYAAKGLNVTIGGSGFEKTDL